MTISASSGPSVATLVVRAVSALREGRHPSFYRLRRATRVLDAMLEPVFPQLRAELTLRGLWQPSDELLAYALLIVARIPRSTSTKSLGEALRSHSRAYSNLRFRTLVTAEAAEELFTQLLRAVQYCGYNVSPFNLVDIVLGWTDARVDETRKRLVMGFYGLSKTEKSSRRATQS